MRGKGERRERGEKMKMREGRRTELLFEDAKIVFEERILGSNRRELIGVGDGIGGDEGKIDSSEARGRESGGEEVQAREGVGNSVVGGGGWEDGRRRGLGNDGRNAAHRAVGARGRGGGREGGRGALGFDHFGGDLTGRGRG